MGMGIGYTNNPYGYNLLSSAFKKSVPQSPASMIDAMVVQANLAAQNATVPSLAQLFPYLNTNYQQFAPSPNMVQSSGAGRFLGSNTMLPMNFTASTTNTSTKA